MIPIEKPGSPGDILEHHGVMGMKWGRRTGGSSSGGSSGGSKSSARDRSREFGKKYPTGSARAKEIRRARARDQKRRVDYKTEKDPAKRAELKKVFLDHPDRATALRTTRGEKVALALLAGTLAPTGVGVGLGIGLGIARTHRQKVEKRQQKL